MALTSPIPGVGGATAGKPDIFGMLRSGLSNNSNALTAYGLSMLGGNPGGSAAAFLQGGQADAANAEAKRVEEEKAARAASLQNAIANLRDKYQRPDLADMVANGGSLDAAWGEVIKGMSPQEPDYPTSYDEFLLGQKDPDYAASLKASDAGGGNYGDTIYSGIGPDGVTRVPLRADPNGGLSVAPMAEGITFDPGGIAGAKTTAVVDAKTAANARAMLPGAEQAYAVTQQALAELASPAGKLGQQDNFGKTLGVIPNQMVPFTMPGTPKATFLNIVDQLSGQSFLLIREALKGAGQVTDFEGMKGEQAVSRMRGAAERGDSDGFNRAVKDYIETMENGMRLLREQAGVEGSPAVGGQPSGNTTQTGVPWSIDP